MNKMPKALRAALALQPRMRRCARHGPDCFGRITWEHAIYYAGRQVQRAWAIVPLCWFHHLGAGLAKEVNRHLALQRATESDLSEFPREDFRQQKKYLESIYGPI